MKGFIEKLIGRLEEESYLVKPRGRSTTDYGDTVVDIGDAIDIVNKLAEEYINTSSDTSSGWIACSERLPKPIDDMLQCVIVTNKNDWQGMAYYHPQKGWIFAECNNSDRKIDWTEIVAWQPLPAPYKEGK